MADVIYSEVFWSFFITTTVGLIIAIIKICAKSKCKKCRFCGCEIERDTEAEEKADEFEMLHRQQNTADESKV